MILSDNETKVDLLNNEAIAATVIKLLREKPERPVTFGVHGDWGAGKSSVLEMIEAGLEDEDDVLCIKFNGWRFQGFEDAKIAFIEGIVSGLVEKCPALNKMKGALKETLERIDWLKIAKRAGGLALTAHTGIPSSDQIQSVVGTLKGWVADPVKLATKENIESTAGELREVLKPTEARHLPEEIEEFRKAFKKLLKEAKVKQLIVLVDDLDRCLPDTAIETLEAIRLFIFSERTAFVVAADEAMIEYSVRRHFPELPNSIGPRDYARNYLEKLIQVPFRIPALGDTETRIYIALLLIGEKLGEEDENFQDLIGEARERLKKPWVSTSFDMIAVKKIIGEEKADEVEEELLLSEQIGQVMASGTKGNPRQIKRFLNALVLRKHIAEARGFGDEIQLPILAKLMLSERFLPSLFEKIASASALASDGICKEVKALEEYVESEKSKKNKKKATEETVKKDKILSEWIYPESILWASIEPSLLDEDLRPYIFVTKETKDFFGKSSSLGKLAEVVDNLMNSKLIVQGNIPELRKLSEVEVTQAFQEVSRRVLRNAKLNAKPSGIDGLSVLSSIHTFLEDNLVDFLESLPTKKIGVWAIAGWDQSIKTTVNKERLKDLLGKWSKSQDNKLLKEAAGAALKI